MCASIVIDAPEVPVAHRFDVRDDTRNVAPIALIVDPTGIPRTLSGKKQEVPIKKLLLGEPIERVLKPEAMSNPQCLHFYTQVAKELGAGH